MVNVRTQFVSMTSVMYSIRRSPPPSQPLVVGSPHRKIMSSTAHGHTGPMKWPEEALYGKASAGKLGMWFFLCSDAFSFSGLLLAYGILRGGSDVWRHVTEPLLGIPFTAGLTFLLICSSVTMVLALAAGHEGNRKGMATWLALTVLGGILFLCGQAQEYFGTFAFIFHHHGLIHDGLHWGQSHYATTFYVITGFHGLHVLTGVIYLSVILVRTLMGKYDGGNVDHVEIAGLFWHFVDLVRIMVFTLVYLIPLE